MREMMCSQGTKLPFRLMRKYQVTKLLPWKFCAMLVHKHSFRSHRIPAVNQKNMVNINLGLRFQGQRSINLKIINRLWTTPFPAISSDPLSLPEVETYLNSQQKKSRHKVYYEYSGIQLFSSCHLKNLRPDQITAPLTPQPCLLI